MSQLKLNNTCVLEFEGRNWKSSVWIRGCVGFLWDLAWGLIERIWRVTEVDGDDVDVQHEWHIEFHWLPLMVVYFHTAARDPTKQRQHLGAHTHTHTQQCGQLLAALAVSSPRSAPCCTAALLFLSIHGRDSPPVTQQLYLPICSLNSHGQVITPRSTGI